MTTSWVDCYVSIFSFTLSSDFNQCRCLQFYFSANLINFSIRNITLSFLENLVCAVWKPVWMYAKQQDCEWNISVFKNSLKIGFEFRFQTVNTSCGAMFEIMKNTLMICSAVWNFFVIAVWIFICVSVKYLRIWSINDKMPAVWKWSL